jgi:hypothetical protein
MAAEKAHSPSERAPSLLSAAALWLWRLANTALLAAGVWILWRQTVQLETLNQQLLDLLDYLNVIAERLG